ncbi:MAG: M48 family metalloprotease [Leptolyngbyaceae cyanobacterium]
MGLNRAPEQLIKAGLAALKQKDYERAIATFQQLVQADNVSAGYRVKAQMGLIRTYEAQGNNTLAQNLCKPLLKSRSQAIRQWSHDKLHQLISDAANSSETTDSGSQFPQSSGFVPASGFMPFTGDAPSTEQTAPLSSTEPSADTVDTHDSVMASSIEEASSIEDAASSEDAAFSVETTRASLFHYETLNNKRSLSAKESEHAEDTAVINSYLTPSKPSDSQSSDDSLPERLASSSSKTLLQMGASKQQNSPFKTVADKSSEDSPSRWPKGDRLTTLKSLGKVKIGRLWFAQLVTIPILFVVVRWLFVTTLTTIRDYLLFISRLLPFNIQLSTFFWQPQTWTVIAGLGLLTIASPWLWPLLLKPTEQVTPQTLQDYSPETVQLLRRVSAKRRFKFPKIYLLASDLPLIFSYGWNPRYGQIVIAQGLLDCLEADELAAIIMYEISHWSTLDWIFFSTHGLLLQGCHRTYWFLVNKGKDRSAIIKTAAGIVATLSYVIFWVLSKVGCGLARTRVPYRDRSATELTGNPNGLVRALSKISTAMTNAVNQQGYTPPLLESLDLMLPVGPGGCVEPTLHHYAWDMLNPLRHWLSINQAHPPLGERLYTLSAYGRHWRLKPSLNVTRLQPRRTSAALSIDDWKTLLLQGGLWSGFILGLGIAVILWMVGAVAITLDFSLLSWLYRDRSILLGIPLICAATNQLLRINPFFPEIGEKRTTSEAQLASWKTDSTLTPLSYRPVTLIGKLTGRPALANWLGQEWRLNTVKGSIKLHYASYLGPLSNIKSLAPWLNQPLEVTGWFRRGYILWVDVDRIQINKNLIKQAQLPIWSMIVSLIPLCCGLWLIFRGA